MLLSVLKFNLGSFSAVSRYPPSVIIDFRLEFHTWCSPYRGPHSRFIVCDFALSPRPKSLISNRFLDFALHREAQSRSIFSVFVLSSTGNHRFSDWMPYALHSMLKLNLGPTRLRAVPYQESLVCIGIPHFLCSILKLDLGSFAVISQRTRDHWFS